jgi:LacI family transcriptional regulator
MANMIDVAKLANVSTMTVSRYFNQPEKLSRATRERVRDAVERLKYLPNTAARAVFSGKSDTLALIAWDVTNRFYASAARGAEDAANRAGFTLILGNTDSTPQKERHYLEVMISKRVDGIILAPVPGNNRNLELLEEYGVPTVVVSHQQPELPFDVVRADVFTGGYRLANHLLERGHRDIAFIGGPPGVFIVQDRVEGYRKAMREAGLDPQVVLDSYRRESGEAIVDKLYGGVSRGPSALIAANDHVALGALIALRRLGLRVPEEVALACFDEPEAVELMEPPLTAITQPAYDIGAVAAKVLIERIGGAGGGPRDHVLPTRLNIRRSSGG